MANSRFHGAAGRWFAKTLEEYAKMIENGASYAELLAWSEGKWPEFGLKYGAWMNARSQRGAAAETSNERLLDRSATVRLAGPLL